MSPKHLNRYVQEFAGKPLAPMAMAPRTMVRKENATPPQPRRTMVCRYNPMAYGNRVDPPRRGRRGAGAGPHAYRVPAPPSNSSVV